MRGLTTRRARAIVRRFDGLRVLVVGDLMLDRFVFGRVDRISPEAPVPVLHVHKEEERAGGSGNVVANVLALGARALACGIVGRDANGRRLVEALRSAGASTDAVVTSSRLPTIEKTRIIAQHQQVVRLDREAVGDVDARAARRIREAVLRHHRRVDVVVLSDYGKGTIDASLLAALAQAYDQRPFLWVVDPKGPNFAHYRRPSLIKPNRDEAAAASGIPIHDAASLRAAGQQLLQKWDAGAVLLSRGEEGLALFRPGRALRQFPTAARDVYDVTGAGDTVIATCALALAAGATLDEATILANHAAGVVVGKVGTATVSAAELIRAIAAW